MTRLRIILFLSICASLLFSECNQKEIENTVVTAGKTKDSCNTTEKDCCKNEKKEVSSKSIITCPTCGYKKEETLPTDVCVIKYTCESCKAVFHPKEGDCCVFCTYGDHKCPSKQINSK